MKGRSRITLKMAGELLKEFEQYSPPERARRIRQVLGDSRSARSFVRRLLPDFYDEVYGEATAAASGRSESAP